VNGLSRFGRKRVAKTLAQRERSRLARPVRELPSCKTSGILAVAAASPIGTLAKLAHAQDQIRLQFPEDAAGLAPGVEKLERKGHGRQRPARQRRACIRIAVIPFSVACRSCSSEWCPAMTMVIRPPRRWNSRHGQGREKMTAGAAAGQAHMRRWPGMTAAIRVHRNLFRTPEFRLRCV